jgi:hypothetical protein
MNDHRDKITVLDDMRRLADAVRAAKVAAADRNDVVVDLRDAERARLEILADDLRDVFRAVPDDDPQWDFVISSGLQPRLWLDATAHVMMGHDRRTYRFVRDTRLGRIVMAESTDVKPIAESVTNYIATRIIERQQLMEGDIRDLRPRPMAAPWKPTPVAGAPRQPAPAGPYERLLRRADWMTGVVWFIIGVIVGLGVLALAFWHSIMAPV